MVSRFFSGRAASIAAGGIVAHLLCLVQQPARSAWGWYVTEAMQEQLIEGHFSCAYQTATGCLMPSNCVDPALTCQVVPRWGYQCDAESTDIVCALKDTPWDKFSPPTRTGLKNGCGNMLGVAELSWSRAVSCWSKWWGSTPQGEQPPQQLQQNATIRKLTLSRNALENDTALDASVHFLQEEAEALERPHASDEL